jgi:hypothetical protein
MVLVVTQYNLPKPCADFARTIVLPVLKLSLNDVKLRNHPLLRRDSPDVEGSAAGKVPTKM